MQFCFKLGEGARGRGGRDLRASVTAAIVAVSSKERTVKTSSGLWESNCRSCQESCFLSSLLRWWGLLASLIVTDRGGTQADTFDFTDVNVAPTVN